MKAVTYQGRKKVEVKEVGNPKIEKNDDILVRVTATAPARCRRIKRRKRCARRKPPGIE